VISDIHLGAGAYVAGKHNYLEDFHHDNELVEFLEYYSTGDFLNREVELIINGDLFDLLAVPFVPFFDDEFWSEKAGLEKLKMIMTAHPEVIEALGTFASTKKKKIVYIIGNHDAEFVHPALQSHLLEALPEKARENFSIRLETTGEYRPYSSVLIKHGHEYEIAHRFNPDHSIFVDHEGGKHFKAPWGSYYVTRVINKFKEERSHINAVRPIKKFMINGLIYDTLFTIRFGLANAFYFIMVRFVALFRQGMPIKEVLQSCVKELELFRDYETLTQDIFKSSDKIKVLIVGHTHEPIFKSYVDGNVFINTGTWMRMFHLDFGKETNSPQLTYAQIDIKEEGEGEEYLESALHVWRGVNSLPFQEFA
jgi:UDP-2,3-diacylglucosamine pyrophosphatase LpxH